MPHTNLTPMKKPEQETQGKDYVVDTRLIKPLPRAGGNLRHDYGESDGSLLELVESIREHGIIEPLKAYRNPEVEGEWIAINGHTRLKACAILNEQGIIIRAKLIPIDARKISDEDLIDQMVVSNTGRPLKMMELAEGVRRLLAYGRSVEEIATKWSKTKVQIRNLEILSNSPKEIRVMIDSGRVSPSVVLNIFKQEQDFNKAIEVLRRADQLTEERVKKDGKKAKQIRPIEVRAAQNKVDSLRELQSLFKRIDEKNEDRELRNPEVYKFARKIANGELIGREIENILFVN